MPLTGGDSSLILQHSEGAKDGTPKFPLKHLHFNPEIIHILIVCVCVS